MNKILYGALGAFFISFPMQAKILVYPRIEDKAVVDDGRYKVYVREAGTENAWRELQVFSVEVDMDTRSRAAMAQFDADEPVEVKVVTPGQMADNIKIRPLSQGISYNKVGEHALTFRLERPAKLSVEFAISICLPMRWRRRRMTERRAKASWFGTAVRKIFSGKIAV